MSFGTRALVAVALMVGFYVLALAIAAGLLWIPYAEYTYANRLHLKILAVCVIGALSILWAILPRPDRFEAPGPLLEARAQPKLFRELRTVAKSTGQSMPSEVYLVSDVNAWVAQRGGMMGFGSRRVMGLGLPLLQALSLSQFRAVLGHEFGHYHGGDTRLGPWIYKTRSAIGRTLQQLGENASFLQAPFNLYGKLFLRVTEAISRAQERAADELSAGIYGARALAEGLQRVHGAALAYPAYWGSEIEPVLGNGYRPPIAAGFATFLTAPRVAAGIARGVDEELNSSRSDPYDSHPPLRERVAALALLPPGKLPAEDPPAISLFQDLPALESKLVETMAPSPEAAARLAPVAWDEVGVRVWQPLWESVGVEQRALLLGLDGSGLADLKAVLPARLSRLKVADDDPDSDEERRMIAIRSIGAALAVALVSRGFRLEAPPGLPVTAVRDGIRLEPFDVVLKLADGELEPEVWRRQVAAAGIADLVMAPAA